MAPPAGVPGPGSGGSRRRRPPVVLFLCWTALLGPILWHTMLSGWSEGSSIHGRAVMPGWATLGVWPGSTGMLSGRASRPAHRSMLERTASDYNTLMTGSEQAAVAAGHSGWHDPVRIDAAEEAEPASFGTSAGSGHTQPRTNIPAVQEGAASGPPDIFLFIGVLSGAGQEQRRAAVREAWMLAAQQPGQVRGCRTTGHTPHPAGILQACSICHVYCRRVRSIARPCSMPFLIREQNKRAARCVHCSMKGMLCKASSGCMPAGRSPLCAIRLGALAGGGCRAGAVRRHHLRPGTHRLLHHWA